MTLGRLVVIAILGAGGCADECLTAEATCDGNTLYQCVQTDGLIGHHWGDEEDCEDGTVCVEVVDGDSRRAATCASSDELDPRCPTPYNGYVFRCGDPDTLLRCHYGYSVEIPCDLACLNSPDGLRGFCLR